MKFRERAPQVPLLHLKILWAIRPNVSVMFGFVVICFPLLPFPTQCPHHFSQGLNPGSTIGAPVFKASAAAVVLVLSAAGRLNINSEL